MSELQEGRSEDIIRDGFSGWEGQDMQDMSSGD